MRAIVIDQFGDEDVMHFGNVDPLPMVDNGLRIQIAATAINRADLLQRQGHYPPPPGASSIIGLECSGTVIETGPGVRGWKIGDRAMALLSGGGYAEETVVDAGSAMKVPDVLSLEEAAAIPEAFLTAWLNLFRLGAAKAGETVLIHGGGSGVGTSAITLCKLAGLRVIVTVGSQEKGEQCLAHGADVAINYKEDDYAQVAGPVDLILDHIGARYLAKDLEILKLDGRVVIIGSMGGESTATIDVGRVLMRRLRIIGSTLRARPVDEKASIVSGFLAQFGGDLNNGTIRPVLYRVLPLAQAPEAHRLMKASEHFGKIVLTTNDRAMD